MRAKNINIEDITSALYRFPIFNDLNPPALEELAQKTACEKLPAGESIFWEEDQPWLFYIIIQGQIKVTKSSSSGKEFIVAFLGPGEIVGDVAVFDNKPYPASAKTLTETVLLGIRREYFISFLYAHPEVALRIIHVLSQRIRSLHQRIHNLIGAKAEQRIAQTILMLSEKLGETFFITRQEIACMAGTTTETAIRTVISFKKRGIIESSRGRITIMDKNQLIAAGESCPGRQEPAES